MNFNIKSNSRLNHLLHFSLKTVRHRPSATRPPSLQARFHRWPQLRNPRQGPTRFRQGPEKTVTRSRQGSDKVPFSLTFPRQGPDKVPTRFRQGPRDKRGLSQNGHLPPNAFSIEAGQAATLVAIKTNRPSILRFSGHSARTSDVWLPLARYIPPIHSRDSLRPRSITLAGLVTCEIAANLNLATTDERPTAIRTQFGAAWQAPSWPLFFSCNAIESAEPCGCRVRCDYRSTPRESQGSRESRRGENALEQRSWQSR